MRFLLGGSGWEASAMPGNVRVLGHVGTGEHNAFFCSGTATLNVNRASMARYGFSPPTRIFEAAGAGACIISDEWPGIEQFLDPGAEILSADSSDAVVRALRCLEPARREQLARAARKRVLSQHTYLHRARRVNELLDGHTRRERAA
jgi:spore maturation protein CgeB